MSNDVEKFAGYHQGAVMYAVGAKVEAKRTSPPSPYTEAELMDDMLAAHKFGRSEQERDMLKRVQGIGTARTRGPIISNHVERSLLVRVKKGKIGINFKYSPARKNSVIICKRKGGCMKLCFAIVFITRILKEGYPI